VENSNVPADERCNQTQGWVTQNVAIERLSTARNCDLTRNPVVAGNGIPIVWVGGEKIPIIQAIHMESNCKLLGVIHAADRLGFLPCFGQCWQQHGSEDRYDGDDNQQLNERKTVARSADRLGFRCFPKRNREGSNFHVHLLNGGSMPLTQPGFL
jgi:hypothetical protein